MFKMNMGFGMGRTDDRVIADSGNLFHASNNGGIHV